MTPRMFALDDIDTKSDYSILLNDCDRFLWVYMKHYLFASLYELCVTICFSVSTKSSWVTMNSMQCCIFSAAWLLLKFKNLIILKSVILHHWDVIKATRSHTEKNLNNNNRVKSTKSNINWDSCNSTRRIKMGHSNLFLGPFSRYPDGPLIKVHLFFLHFMVCL